jgi:hydrogenase maturation protease
MNVARIRPIVDAVLYEGYVLYPYRATATKNRQRWTFGGVYPLAWHRRTGGAEPWQMQTQCLVEGDAAARLEVRVRFLHPLAREPGALTRPLAEWPAEGEPAFTPAPVLRLGGREVHRWQEAVERDLPLPACSLGELLGAARRHDFAVEGARTLEPLLDEGGAIGGVVLRRQPALRGRVELRAEAVGGHAWRLTVLVANDSAMPADDIGDREEASLYSFASTHTLLGVEGGAFVSLMDPPEALRQAAAGCDNRGCYPVLVGEQGRRDGMLSSPIILYDYPEIAPESPGDLYDATEIDELLSLTVLALPEAERREIAATDPRAAALLRRIEGMDAEDLMRLHGALREPRALAAEPRPRLAHCNDGRTPLTVGARVRLRPRAGGDALDLVLAGRTAVIEGIERDFEDRLHVAVTIDDDPGREWGLERMPGHRFFFSPEEIEPLPEVRP